MSKTLSIALALGGAVLTIALTGRTPGLAQQQPLPQHMLSRGATSVSTDVREPLAAHDVSGTIVLLRGRTLTVRLRNGRFQAVDARQAFVSGRVSAPLFVGKHVDVAGTYDARRVLVAQSITRMERVDATTPRDY